jgi:hypothetical protein
MNTATLETPIVLASVTNSHNRRALMGHVSQETAYIIQDYPYGSLRTQKRVWLEYREGFGFREMHQTLNPKRNFWNKPHAGQYSALIVLVKQDVDDFGNPHKDYVTAIHAGTYNFTPQKKKEFADLGAMNEILHPNLFRKFKTPSGGNYTLGEMVETFEGIARKMDMKAWEGEPAKTA